jgi:glycerophosphoryl diester phosphodiesterase
MTRNRLLKTVLLFLLLQVGAWARPWVVAHRGGAALGPENSLNLFEKAASMGVDAIELDIHQSSDGHLMVLHDVTLQRTHGSPERVDRLPMKTLQKIGVPTLQQAIDTVNGRCLLFVEVKHPRGGRHLGIERRLLKVLRENDLIGSAVVISFDAITIRRLHTLEPKLKTGFLYSRPWDSVTEIKKLGVSYICPYFLLATPRLVEEAHSQGLKVVAWTVNDKSVMQTLIELNCDTIFTDHPDVLKSCLQDPILLK